jgi:dihydroorotate dehydrogenase
MIEKSKLLMQSTYDVTKSTAWNIEHGPLFTGEIPARKDFPAKTKIWNFELNSPLGVPAGPLFNSKFIELYAKLGFDILTYKTLRTVAREAHRNPNIVYLNVDHQLSEQEIGGNAVTRDEPSDMSELSITNSFGMNSMDPKDWQADVAKANGAMADGQLMIVSIVGTPEQGDVIADYVKAAALAKDAGAKVIEANYSCPNVVSGEGMICYDPQTSAEISKRVKAEIGNIPFIIKLGYFENKKNFADVIDANAPHVDGVSLINTIKMAVVDEKGEQALPGKDRLYSGTCGNAIRSLAQTAVKEAVAMKRNKNYDFEIIGVGGIVLPEHVDEYINLGATIAMSGTGAMWDPLLANKYYQYKKGF